MTKDVKTPKKTTIFIVIAIAIILALFSFIRTFYHFKIHSGTVFLSAVENTNGKVSFDLTHADSVCLITDYDYRIKNDNLYITFYSSYPIFEFLYRSPVEKVSIDTGCEIAKIIGIYTDNEKIMWEEDY